MDVSKLKNIAILILVLVNLTFGLLLLSQRNEKANQIAQTNEEIVSVMRKLGVSLKAAVIPNETPYNEYRFARDSEAEAKMASEFLGETQKSDRGGSIYVYESENGRAVFRNGGSIMLQLNSAVGNLERKLENSGIQCRRTGDLYYGLFEGRTIFNSTLQFSSVGEGISLNGLCLLGELRQTTEVKSPGCAAILLRFRELMFEQGEVFTEIKGIESGYLLISTSSAIELQPVWSIQTDGGSRFVSVVDGSIVGYGK